MTQAYARYFDDCGNKNPDVNTTALEAVVHALYTRWVRAHYHRRDFICALEHTAELFFTEWLMAGRPDLRGMSVELTTLALAPKSKREFHGPEPRFYDELSSINPDIDDSAHRPALAPHFAAWCSANFAPRDFMQAVSDVAKVVVYDHELAMSFGGMGGGKDSETFLSTPYKA